MFVNEGLPPLPRTARPFDPASIVAPLEPQTDPNGKDQHAPGAKLDAGKTMMALVLGGFAPALVGIAKVGTFGARKYTPNGWKSVPDGESRYMDALLRHLFAYMDGETHDPESKLHHLWHAGWNLLAVITLGRKA